jgi:putative hydrolase of HD superfamily
MSTEVGVLLEVLALKALPRTGWVRRGMGHPESVAAHSHGVAWLVLALLPEELDLRLALSYAVLHDLPECRVGDLTPGDGVSRQEKHQREERAMGELCAPLARGAELFALWQRYEQQADEESRFVRQLDRLDMALQAVRYRDQLDPSEFLESAAAVVVHPRLVPILAELRLSASP